MGQQPEDRPQIVETRLLRPQDLIDLRLEAQSSRSSRPRAAPSSWPGRTHC